MGIEATKWLVEEKLKLHPKEINCIIRADFVQHGLDGMLNVVFKGRHKNALKVACSIKIMGSIFRFCRIKKQR